MVESGKVLRCSKEDNTELFRQTCGGMGLTGIILSARFRLLPVETSYIRQRSQKAADLNEAIKLFEDADKRSYSVAWVDSSTSRTRLGQSILISGEHCNLAELPGGLQKRPLAMATNSRFSLPFYMPSLLLNRITVRAFNFLYYHKQLKRSSVSLQHYESFFFPLDGIRDWNRLYGRKGFVQYQFVLPKENGYDGLKAILDTIARSGLAAPLSVLKLFGKENPDAVMSFPMEGYTLAVDLRVSEKVFRLLDRLDELVLKYKGRIYLAKDARMSSRLFHATYPDALIPVRFRSLQSTRLNDSRDGQNTPDTRSGILGFFSKI